MDLWERLTLERLYEWQLLQPEVEEAKGTPLIIPRIAGFAREEGWIDALTAAIAAAEKDFEELSS